MTAEGLTIQLEHESLRREISAQKKEQSHGHRESIMPEKEMDIDVSKDLLFVS